MATQVRTPVQRASHLNMSGVLANGFLFICLGCFLVPLVWLFLASTKSNSGLFSSFGFWFDRDFHLFQNLSDVFARDNGVFLIWMRNTAIYAVSAAIGSPGATSCLSLSSARFLYRPPSSPSRSIC